MTSNELGEHDRETSEPDNNPLLSRGGTPPFNRIDPEHVEPAVTAVLAELRDAVAHLEGEDEPDIAWLQGVERIHERLQRVWGPISHLNSVASTPALREAFNLCLPRVTAFESELGQNEALFKRLQQLSQSLPDGGKVETAVVNDSLRDFRLGGVALPAEKKERFRSIMQSLAAREALFEQNVMDASAAFEHHETEAEALAGLPSVVIDRAQAAAQQRQLEGWLLPLDMPTYAAVMQHADSRALRKCFYDAWVTRASDQGPAAGRWDNGPLIVEILALRHEVARLLGFQHYAELSLATKMAESTASVLEFLHDLACRGKPLAEANLTELTAAAGRALEAWDLGYFTERLQSTQLNIDQEALRPYFPLPQVRRGLFELAGKLFGIVIEEQPTDATWDKNVCYYDIRQRAGRHVGGFFTDLFARPNKRGGAWMDSCLDRAQLLELEQDPVGYLVCNFNPPLGDSPSLLTHDEVVTLFHEFGHLLHHLMTRVDYPSLAGINGVEWDAVEMPSQFLENFAWQHEVLQSLARHYRTNEPLPSATINALQRSRSFQAGLAMQRQLEFSLFDFRIHSLPEAPSLDEVYRILGEVRQEVALVETPACNRFPNSFEHIFAGGYAAGYYSYKWAEVLAADVYSAFEEHGVLDTTTASRFVENVLAVGGSRPALESFICFRGRPPELGPLLKQAGIEMR